MKKIILIVLPLIMCLTVAYGQHKRKAKRTQYPTSYFKMPYDKALVNNINNLQFDSVKIFSFGCSSGLKSQPKNLLYKESRYGFLLSDGLVDATQHWLPLLSDTGQIFSKQDVEKTLYLFKNIHHDIYGDDPTGCFEPHMGIVFYKGPLVNAHMDICLGCGRINFDKFGDGKNIYRYELVVLGVKTRAYFESLVNKYRLITCR